VVEELQDITAKMRESIVLSNEQLFWAHVECCRICNQHPQSVASFYYEPMCLIGKAYREAAHLPGPQRMQPRAVLAGEQGYNERVEGS